MIFDYPPRTVFAAGCCIGGVLCAIFTALAMLLIVECGKKSEVRGQESEINAEAKR